MLAFKDTEVPQKCIECPCVVPWGSKLLCKVSRLQEIRDLSSKPAWCKAIDVAEPEQV